MDKVIIPYRVRNRNILGQRTKDKGQRTKDKGQIIFQIMTKDKGQRTKDKGQRNYTLLGNE